MAGRLVLSLVYRDGQCCSHFRSEGNCGTGNGQSLGLMDSVPGSTTNLLCDPGQVLFPLSAPQFPHLQNGENSLYASHLLGV